MKINNRFIFSGLMCLFLAAFAFGQVAAQQKPLPNLALDRIDGEKWNLTDNRGSIVLLNFWATWCAPCRSEIPVLVNLSNKYKADGLKVVGVSLDSENVAQINKFLKDFKINYPIVLAAPGSLLSQQKAIPMSLLIDEKGILAKKYVGAIEESILEKDIKALLGRRITTKSKMPAGAKKIAPKKEVNVP